MQCFSVVFSVRFLVLLMSWLCHQTIAQPIYYYHFCLNSDNSPTPTGKYRANLANLLSSFSSFAADQPFNSTINGSSDGNNKAYGIYLCRNDLNATRCQSCVSTASKEILRLCPNEVSAVIWYDICMLRYSDKNFFGTVTTSRAAYDVKTAAFDYPDEAGIAKQLMLALIETVKYSSVPAYAAGTSKGAANETRYGLVQCTGDLNISGCDQCLKWMVPQISLYVAKRKSWWFLTPSCIMRYDHYDFYKFEESTPAKNTHQALAISSCLIYNVRRSNRKAKDGLRQTNLLAFRDNVKKECSVNVDLLMIPLETIQHSTNHFSDQCKLGEGGFGRVYKGTLPDGSHFAVKRLSKTSRQGLEELKNEIVSIARLHHKNLVSLLGCCLEQSEKLLVYEYMANASLDSHLFDKEKNKKLVWNGRMNIIIGIANGLLYLHEDSGQRVIHRDLKASNILLDQDMTPKISDFGLAKTLKEDQRQANTRRIAGTYGYMAPEYAIGGLFSTKSDIFSFGVLMLEIVSGKRNTRFYPSEHGLNLLTYAWRLWCEGKAMMLMDPVLEDSFKSNEVLRCIHIGLLCVQEDAANRPNMPTILNMLSRETMILSKPRQPAFSTRYMVMEQEPAIKNSKNCSINQVTISNVVAR